MIVSGFIVIGVGNTLLAIGEWLPTFSTRGER